jgi:hypothetical protein
MSRRVGLGERTEDAADVAGLGRVCCADADRE